MKLIHLTATAKAWIPHIVEDGIEAIAEAEIHEVRIAGGLLLLQDLFFREVLLRYEQLIADMAVIAGDMEKGRVVPTSPDDDHTVVLHCHGCGRAAALDLSREEQGRRDAA